MQLKKAIGFQTSDGQIHTDKSSALAQEFKLNVRGLINENNLTKKDSFNTIELSNILFAKIGEFSNLLKDYKVSMSRIKSKSCV